MPKLKEIKGYPTLGLDVRSGLIYLRGSYPGLGQIVRSTRERDLGRAIRAAKHLEREILKLDPHYRPQTICEVWDEVKIIRSLEWRKGSEETATQVVERNLLPCFGGLPIDAMSDVRWAKFVKKFQKDNPGKKLFNTQKYMKMITNHAHKKGYLREKLDLPFTDQAEREGLEMSFEHYEKLLAACVNQAWCDDTRFAKLKLFTIIGYWMGCRRREILGLSWDRVNLTENTFTFGKEHVKTGSKTGRGRTIRIAPEVIPHLKQWKIQSQSSWLFPQRGKDRPMLDNHTVWARALERAKLKNYTPNDLRHTFFTRKILIEKQPIVDVAIYGGTSVAMLEKTYLHNQSEHTKNVAHSPRKLKAVQ